MRPANKITKTSQLNRDGTFASVSSSYCGLALERLTMTI